MSSPPSGAVGLSNVPPAETRETVRTQAGGAGCQSEEWLQSESVPQQ